MALPTSAITYAEVIAKGVASAQGSGPVNVISVFHYQRNNNFKPLDKAALESVFQSAVVAKLLLAVNNTYTQSWVSVRWIEDPTDAAQEFAEVGVGAVAGDRLATFNSAYLLLKSSLRGKSFRGSKHIGPLSEADTTAGTGDILNAAALLNFGALAVAVAGTLTDSANNAWSPVVLSRKLSNFAVTPCLIAASGVTAVLVNKRIGTMRRRKVASVY